MARVGHGRAFPRIDCSAKTNFSTDERSTPAVVCILLFLLDSERNGMPSEWDSADGERTESRRRTIACGYCCQMMLTDGEDARVRKIADIDADVVQNMQRECLDIYLFIFYSSTQIQFNTVKTVKSRTVSTGQKGSKSTYNCPKRYVNEETH